MGMGFTEIQNGEYMNALICFRGALTLDPESLDALYNIGRCCEDIAERNDGKRLEQDFTKTALLIFERIIELFPDSHLGYYHVGFHYANLKQYAQAEAMWHEALKEKTLMKNKQLELVEKIIELQDKVITKKDTNWYLMVDTKKASKAIIYRRQIPRLVELALLYRTGISWTRAV